MGQTDKTLLEQMQISELEIHQRMKLFSITDDDLAMIKRCRPIIDKHLDELVDAFYNVQTNIPDIALLIGDAGTLDRLRAAQRGYIADLFIGYYDLEYVNNRLRIGMVHKRIGVEPKLYLSAVHTLKEMINEVIERESATPEDGMLACKAVEKVLMFDVTLVFDTYIRSLLSEIETAKVRSDSYARELEAQVHRRTQELEDISKTDSLTGLLNVRSMLDTLVHALRGAQRRKRVLSLVYIDVNNLKQINDTEGHQRGDEVLTKFARALGAISRGEDWCYRYGGDEFCVILPECSESDAKEIYGVRLRTLLLEDCPGLEYSLGVAQAGPDIYPTPEDLIQQADRRMYKMKELMKAQSSQQQVND